MREGAKSIPVFACFFNIALLFHSRNVLRDQFGCFSLQNVPILPNNPTLKDSYFSIARGFPGPLRTPLRLKSQLVDIRKIMKLLSPTSFPVSPLTLQQIVKGGRAHVVAVARKVLVVNENHSSVPLATYNTQQSF